MFTARQLQNKVNDLIEHLSYKREPHDLYLPVEYTLSGGGKRIRPVLMLMAYNLYEEDVEPAMYAAAAIELYHNHTLLHDDVMDRADVRHGRPTVHRVWNESQAILSGDTMLVLAYRYVSKIPKDLLDKVFELFSTTAIEIAEGQQYDLEFESREQVTQEEYIEMIRLKTSVLLAGSLKIGGLLGRASEEDLNCLYRLGESIGLAFQLQDDLLDVYGDPETFGKNIGGDILCNKKTFMLIQAMARAGNEQRASLQRWLDCKPENPQEKITAVRGIYDALHIKELCEQKIDGYFEEGEKYLSALSLPDERKKELHTFLRSLMSRKT